MNRARSSAFETIWPAPQADGLTSDVTSSSVPAGIGTPEPLPT
jgi:hypothetical protein